MNTKEKVTKIKKKQKAKTKEEYEQMLLDYIKDEFKGVI